MIAPQKPGWPVRSQKRKAATDAARQAVGRAQLQRGGARAGLNLRAHAHFARRARLQLLRAGAARHVKPVVAVPLSNLSAGNAQGVFPRVGHEHAACLGPRSGRGGKRKIGA